MQYFCFLLWRELKQNSPFLTFIKKNPYLVSACVKTYPVLQSESEAKETIRLLNNEMSHITRGGLEGQRTCGILKVKMSTFNLPLKYTNFMVVWLQVPGM